MNRRFLEQRVTETLDLAYEIHWPYQQRTSARGLRRSPLHDRVAAAGAVFGELLGWERANWYAPPGVPRTYDYSFGRQNWFEHSAAEHRAVRERVAMFDTSSFGKLLVQGRDAAAVLQRICANDVAVPPGRIVYTQWLNDRGGIEADVTVTRLADTQFLVLSGPATVGRDLDWLHRSIRDTEFATVTDISPSLAMIPVMGPDSRRLLQPLTDTDLSNAAFPFGTSREIDLGCGFVRPPGSPMSANSAGSCSSRPTWPGTSTTRSPRPVPRSGSSTPGTTHWTRYGWRRRTGAGDTTYRAATVRWKPVLASPWRGISRASSLARRQSLSKKKWVWRGGFCNSRWRIRLRWPTMTSPFSATVRWSGG